MTGIEILLIIFICALVLFNIYIQFKINAIIDEVDTHNAALIFILKHCTKDDDESNSVKKS